MLLLVSIACSALADQNELGVTLAVQDAAQSGAIVVDGGATFDLVLTIDTQTDPQDTDPTDNFLDGLAAWLQSDSNLHAFDVLAVDWGGASGTGYVWDDFNSDEVFSGETVYPQQLIAGMPLRLVGMEYPEAGGPCRSTLPDSSPNTWHEQNAISRRDISVTVQYIYDERPHNS